MTDPFSQPDSSPVPGSVSGGKYVLPHPATGEPAKWSRTTTFIKRLDDTFALTEWRLQRVVLGLARREDLYAEACTLSDGDDLDAINELVSAAHDAAEGNHGRRVGSALHRFTERVNRGEESGAPARWAPKVELYQAALKAHALVVVPDLIERTVVNLTYGCAGTFDNGLLDALTGRLVVGDLKSKRKIYGYGSEALQFAMYAYGDAMWDPVAGVYVDMPPFDRDVAKMIWLPVAGDTCEVHDVDIARGWEMLKLCDQVRLWQNEQKRKNAVGRQVAPPSAMAITEAYARRIKAASSRFELSALWREADGLGVWSAELAELGKLQVAEFDSRA